MLYSYFIVDLSKSRVLLFERSIVLSFAIVSRLSLTPIELVLSQLLLPLVTSMAN